MNAVAKFYFYFYSHRPTQTHTDEKILSADDTVGENQVSPSGRIMFFSGTLLAGRMPDYVTNQYPAQRVTGFALPGWQSKWSVCVRVRLWLIMSNELLWVGPF